MHNYSITKHLSAGLLLVLVLTMSFYACKRSTQEPDDITTWNMDITKSIFGDTLYEISTMNVESTNSDIISLATVKVTDQDGNEICNDIWSNLLNYEFGLQERKIYVLTAVLYDAQEPIDTETFVLDNIKYPTHIEVTDLTLLNPDFSKMSDASTSHTSLLKVFHYDWDAQIHDFYSDKYPPKETSFNKNSSINGTVMKLQRTQDYDVSCIGSSGVCYSIMFSYAQVIGSSIVGEYKGEYQTSMNDLIDFSDIDFNKTYVDTLGPDHNYYTDGAILTYKLLYEN